MQVYYVLPYNSGTSLRASLQSAVLVTGDSLVAREYADLKHQDSGEHHYVVKAEIVWSTMTVDELMDEEEGA